MLESLPGVGKVKARRTMEEIGISETRRVRGLGVQQREALLETFPAEAATAAADRRHLRPRRGRARAPWSRACVDADPRLWLSRRGPPGRAARARPRTRTTSSTDDEFEARVAADGFLEWAEFLGYLLRHAAARPAGGRRDIVLEIDVQGAAADHGPVPRRPADLRGRAVARGAGASACGSGAIPTDKVAERLAKADAERGRRRPAPRAPWSWSTTTSTGPSPSSGAIIEAARRGA